MAQQTLAKMTGAQKFQMVHGAGGGYVGNVGAITLSDGTVIPPINLEDGPQGVADGVRKVTAWPSALTVVQSWDTTLMNEYGKAMGREQYLKGTNVMLGPGVNLARVPWCGRNFEYQVSGTGSCPPPSVLPFLFSLGSGLPSLLCSLTHHHYLPQGEDPVLAAAMIKAEITGIQSNNISACVKHYVFNSQEFDRSGQSANVPLRAAKELYYKPFAAAVDAGVGSAMCSVSGAESRPLRSTHARDKRVSLLTSQPPPSLPPFTTTPVQSCQRNLGMRECSHFGRAEK